MYSCNCIICNHIKDKRGDLIVIFDGLYEHGHRVGGKGTISVNIGGIAGQFGTNRVFGRLGGVCGRKINRSKLRG